MTESGGDRNTRQINFLNNEVVIQNSVLACCGIIIKHPDVWAKC